MSFHLWVSLAALCLLGAMTPGPSLAVVLGSTLQGGRAAGLAAALAHGLAVGLYGLLTVIGLAALVTAAPRVFAVVQFAAAVYLLYLAWSALRHSRALAVQNTSAARPTSPRAAARDGFLIAFLNPKLAIFMLALFAPFISADQGVSAKAVLVLTIGGIDALWYSAVVVLVVRSGLLRWLEQQAARVTQVYAALLAVFAVFVASRALPALH